METRLAHLVARHLTNGPILDTDSDSDTDAHISRLLLGRRRHPPPGPESVDPVNRVPAAESAPLRPPQATSPEPRAPQATSSARLPTSQPVAPSVAAAPAGRHPRAAAPRRRPETVVQENGLHQFLPRHVRQGLTDRLPGRSRETARVATDAATLAAAVEALGTRLDGSKSEGRWRDLAGVYAQFSAWDAEARQHPSLEGCPLDYRMLTWLESKIQAGHISRSTPLEYAKRLSFLHYQAFGERSILFRDAIAGLRRTPGLRAEQATPMTEAEFFKVVENCETEWMETYFVLMWFTASRAKDMARLQVQSFVTELTPREDGNYRTSITWKHGVKASHLPHTDIILLSEERTAMLHRVLANCASPHDHPFDAWDASDVAAQLQRLSGNDKLTAHSVKRGVLQLLVEKGVSLTQVSYKAKHADEGHTRVYLGSENWAVAHDAELVSERLL